ncbi:hypothetical protein HMPREF3224_00937, partial [Anaerococcus hydrogenalis]
QIQTLVQQIQTQKAHLLQTLDQTNNFKFENKKRARNLALFLFKFFKNKNNQILKINQKIILKILG